MPTYVALLRGINLGSRRRVAMADLRGWLADLGCAEVRTFLQSGNAVFHSDAGAAALTGRIEAELERRAGFPVPCVLRTAAELRAAVEADLFREVAADPKFYLVSFLADGRARSPDLDPAAFLPERFHIGERETYVWLPDGFRNSKLLTALAAHEGVATSRNWNTVVRLLALTG